MKKIFIGLILLASALLIYRFFRMSAEKKPPSVESTQVELKAHSEEFSEKTESALDAYMAMKDAFVEFDTAGARKNAWLFIHSLEGIDLNELQKDGAGVFQSAEMTRNEIIKYTHSLINKQDITGMRKEFSSVSDFLYPGFLKLINYRGPRIYLQYCPMAFYDTMGANWLSNSAEIMNPYLGRFDPKYRSGMLHCGEVLDSTGRR